MSRASHILCTQAAAAIAAADAPGKGKEIAEALYDKAYNDGVAAALAKAVDVLVDRNTVMDYRTFEQAVLAVRRGNK